MRYIFILCLFILTLHSNEKGESLYSSCKFCHGYNGKKIYENIVPSINNLDLSTLELKLKLYKQGLIDEYGFGPIMKQQMINIPNKEIPVLSKYIKWLEKPSYKG